MVFFKKNLLIFAALFILLIVTPVLLNVYYNFLLKPVSTKASEDKIFVIAPGTPVVTIAQNLKQQGLVKNSHAFRFMVDRMGIGKNIQAGDFRLSPSMPSKEIAEELTHGAIDVWITFPEGLRAEEQAEIIQEKLKFGSNDSYQFDKNEYTKIAEEGYMFPDTYLIPKDASAKDVASLLRNTFDEKVLAETLKSTTTELTPNQIITLSSIVEREAKTKEEKPIIAGILTNRLNEGMALQVDATVQYAKGYDEDKKTWWPQVTTDDYKSVKSLYNTYLRAGLPPGPISSPGLDSIMAVISPQDTEYFYYLHDTDGNVHYAKTGEEHNQNIEQYLL